MRMHNSKWLLAAGLLAGAVLAYRSRSEVEQWIRRHQFRLDGFEQVQPSEIYLLETNRWLEFDIPLDAPIARLVSNASISPAQRAVPGTQWPYAIEYQLRGGQTNLSGVYHFKGEQVAFVDKQSGKPAAVNTYLDHRLAPLSGRQWMLNIRDPAVTDARVLRLRLHASHPELLEVGVRVYFRTAVPERKITYLWDRLSDDQKRDLARGNVYSFEGLNANEKYCLLRYHWEVGSPAGIPGRDFERHSLYVRDDSERLQEIRDWVPAGLAVDREHFGVLPITNAAGGCQLQLVDYAAAAMPQTVSSTFLWHGQQQQRIETNQLTWSGSTETESPFNGDGLMQISSSRPVYVRAFQADSGRTNEITPEPDHLLTFTCSPTNTVEYSVDHIGQEPTFFRIDIRRSLPAAGEGVTPAGAVQCALLAGDGSVLQASEVMLTNAFSPFDWLVTNNGLANITVPQSLCFIFPPAVRGLRIAAPDETVFVNAYSRPYRLVKRVRVPEDYSPARTTAPEQPSWFTVRPRDYLDRREAGQASIVRVQTHPPVYDPLVQSGQYEWDSFLPATESRGQMILLPPTDGQPARADSLAFSYFPVTIGGEQRVRFRGQPWQSQVEPSLVLVFTNGIAGPATVTVDGQVLLDNRLEAPVTAVRLGSLPTGEHTLTIASGGSVSAYLNYLDSSADAAYLQRFCTLASSNALTFPYQKREADAEVLVLRIFSPLASGPQPFDVHVKLKGEPQRSLGPHSELTFLNREAQVTPGPVGRTWLVAGATAQLDDGQAVFFPVGPDLPPGQYELEVKIAAASPRWISLSRTTPGLAEKLKLSSQHSLY
jgi:hypothetical protein